MAFFRIKVGEKTYELDKCTLGDARVLKQHFGLDDLENFSTGDPDVIVGLLYLCLKRENPAKSHDDLVAEVEAFDIDQFDEADDEPDPTPAKSTRASRAKPKGGA